MLYSAFGSTQIRSRCKQIKYYFFSAFVDRTNHFLRKWKNPLMKWWLRQLSEIIQWKCANWYSFGHWTNPNRRIVNFWYLFNVCKFLRNWPFQPDTINKCANDFISVTILIRWLASCIKHITYAISTNVRNLKWKLSFDTELSAIKTISGSLIDITPFREQWLNAEYTEFWPNIHIQCDHIKSKSIDLFNVEQCARFFLPNRSLTSNDAKIDNGC